MGVARDVSSSAAISGSNTLSWSHSCAGANRAVGVGVTHNNGSTPTSVTYNGVALTNEIVRTLPIDVDMASLWSLIAPASGPNTVSITIPLAPDIVGGALSVVGANQSDCVTMTSSATGTGTTPATTIASADDELVLAVITGISNTTATPGPGETEEWESSATATNLEGFGYSEQGAAFVTISPTRLGASEWGIAAMSFRSSDPQYGDVSRVDLTQFPKAFMRRSFR